MLGTSLCKGSERVVVNVARKSNLSRVQRDSSNVNWKIVPKRWTDTRVCTVNSCWCSVARNQKISEGRWTKQPATWLSWNQLLYVWSTAKESEARRKKDLDFDFILDMEPVECILVYADIYIWANFVDWAPAERVSCGRTKADVALRKFWCLRLQLQLRLKTAIWRRAFW